MPTTMHKNSPSRESVTTGQALPNFLGLGAQRAATTWVYNCLREHPDVFIPATKEIGYFRWRYEEGLEWYRSQFEGYAGEKAVGEITPGYLHSDQALSRITGDLPNVRVFAILREPVERAFSAYRLYHASLKGQSFTEACLARRDLIEESLYARSLESLQRLFDSDHRRVFLYDDVRSDPHGVVKELYRFLGVDPEFVPPSVHTIYNHISHTSERCEAALARSGLGWLIPSLKRTRIGSLIKQRLVRSSKKSVPRIAEGIPPEVLGRFREDIARVEQILGRDLSSWKQ